MDNIVADFVNRGFLFGSVGRVVSLAGSGSDGFWAAFHEFHPPDWHYSPHMELGVDYLRTTGFAVRGFFQNFVTLRGALDGFCTRLSGRDILSTNAALFEARIV